MTINVYTVMPDGRHVHYCAGCRHWFTCGVSCWDPTVQDCCPWCAGDGETLTGAELLEAPRRSLDPTGELLAGEASPRTLDPV